jgi:hypothetical protein
MGSRLAHPFPYSVWSFVFWVLKKFFQVVTAMLTWFKQVFYPNEKRDQNKILTLPISRVYSAEKRYVIECLKLKGYLLYEDVELRTNLIADILLKKENVAILFIDDAASPLVRTNLMKRRAAVHELGLQCFIFERAHFYKSLRRLHFRLRQHAFLEGDPPGSGQ